MRFSRATSGLERLVVIGHAGYVTLEALRSIRDLHASFAQTTVMASSSAISPAERSTTPAFAERRPWHHTAS